MQISTQWKNPEEFQISMIHYKKDLLLLISGLLTVEFRVTTIFDYA